MLCPGVLPSNSKPVRDVDMELRGELDEFVQAILAEYAKLFLQAGSEVTPRGVESPTSSLPRGDTYLVRHWKLRAGC